MVLRVSSSGPVGVVLVGPLLCARERLTQSLRSGHAAGVAKGLKAQSGRTRYFTMQRDVAGDEKSAAWRRCASSTSRTCFLGQVNGFLSRGAAHAAEAGVPVLFIVPSATSTDYWARSVWPHASGVCHLNPRPRFNALEADGSQRESEHPTSISAVLFGGNLERFIEVWGARGPIVRSVSTSMAARISQPGLFDHVPADISIAVVGVQ